MNNKALKLLEYNKILDKLVEQARSSLAKKEIAGLRPMANIHMVSDALTETTEAVSVILRKGSIPVGDFKDLSLLLDMSRKGRILSMKQLLIIRYNLAITREVKTFLSSELPVLPTLDEMTKLLVVLNQLERDIDRCILSEDEMADAASTQLKNIRRSMRGKNESIKNRLYQMTNSSSMRTYLQDAIVTIRDGRYVIPVKQEHRNLVPGMIHDSSQSGATLFIEPQAVVDMNNDLRQLQIAENTEIERILSEFTERIAEHYHELVNNQKLLVELDVINAKGKLSCLMDAEEPIINTDGVINIKKGRHPLIDKEQVVPINVSLGKDFKTLIITGPNTGGKTVTLKTIGLFVLMAESGLHIPCSATSEIALFNEVFADVGDEQSIEQSLSTFSSHMKNIVSIVQVAEEHSLVLFDELGAGTDPTEGAALGIAILEKLRKKGAYIAATTHYTELKKYALSTPEIENASMEFDINTLSPTYKLRIGLPGKSNAFEISRKLGLEDDIIERAGELINNDDLEFEQVISSIENDKKKAEEELESALNIKADAEKKLKEAEEKLSESTLKKTDIIAEAKENARDMIRDARETTDQIRNELKDIDKVQSLGKRNEMFAESRRILKSSEKKYASTIEKKGNSNITSIEQVGVGQRVKILTIGQTGEVVSAPDSRGNLLVQVGSLKMNANIKNLMLIENEKPGNKEKQRNSYSKIYNKKAKTIAASVNVRGMNLDEATMETDKYLDDAYLGGLKKVTIIHGRGEGILKDGLRTSFKRNKHIKSFRTGTYNEGGEGVTIVELKGE